MFLQPIVEGHGEVAAVPLLLNRVWQSFTPNQPLIVLPPIRVKRQRIVDARLGDLEKYASLAARKLRACRGAEGLVMLLLDADSDCPKELAESLRSRFTAIDARMRFSCVIANPEYETWFVASAVSLANHLDLTSTEIPADPENDRSGKRWVNQHLPGRGYRETIDQPRFTRAMDLDCCQQTCPSFAKLIRELKACVPPDPPPDSMTQLG